MRRLLQPLFILDEPHYHRLAIGEANRFRGLALAIDGAEIERIAVYRDGVRVFESPLDLPSPDLAPFVRLPRAGNCRFDFELEVGSGSALEIRGLLMDGGEVPLFVYDVPLAEREGSRLRRLSDAVARYPVPDSEVIALSQGGGNAGPYRDSIVSGVLTTEALLRGADVPVDGLRAILDIGCATGRSLVGWHGDDPSRRLAGVDINADMIAWNRASLPDVAEWQVGAVDPPVDLPDASFDLVQLVSVFTHLPLDCQRAWLAEIRRLLRPGGAAMITLHGEIYARLLLDAATREEFDRRGYVEMPGAAAGLNAYSTFHSPAFARELFRDFPRVTRYARGMPEAVARFFPVGSLQDLYVLTSDTSR